MSTTVDIAEIEARRDAGAALLDEREPGWWREDHPFPINLDELDILSACNCVLGQTWDRTGGLNPFFGHSTRLFGDIGMGLAAAEVEHGFLVDDDPNLPDGAYHAEAEALTDAWKRLILARRAESEAADA